MTLYVKDTNIKIDGVLQNLTGTALVTGLDADGTLIFNNDTIINGDSAQIALENGLPVWVRMGEDGEESEEFCGVEVEDRTESGVIGYRRLEDELTPKEELSEAIQALITIANKVMAAPTSTRNLVYCAKSIKDSMAASAWAIDILTAKGIADLEIVDTALAALDHKEK
jgi:hypothetical protein